MNQETNPQATYEDEISLLQLWQILVRRQRLIYITFGVIFLLGLLVALIKPNAYTYKRIIQLPSAVSSGKIGSILNNQNALIKFNEIYIPSVLQQYQETHRNLALPEIQAKALKSQNEEDTNNYRYRETKPPELTTMIALTSDVTKNKSSLFNHLSQQILNQFAQNGAITMKVRKTYMEATLADLQSQLTNNQLAYKTFQTQLRRLEANHTALRKQAANEQRQGTQIMSSSGMQSGSTESLMLAQQIMQNLSSLTNLQFNTIPMNIISLNRTLLQLKTVQTTLQNKVNQTRAVLTSMNAPRFVGGLVHSQKPVGLNKLSLLAVSAFLGFFLSIMLAFIMEFISAARARVE